MLLGINSLGKKMVVSGDIALNESPFQSYGASSAI